MVWTRLILSIVGLFAHMLNGIDQCWTACIMKYKVFSPSSVIKRINIHIVVFLLFKN